MNSIHRLIVNTYVSNKFISSFRGTFSVGLCSILDHTTRKKISRPNDSYIRSIHYKKLVTHSNNFYTS